VLKVEYTNKIPVYMWDGKGIFLKSASIVS
jgi:hypothetical protein